MPPLSRALTLALTLVNIVQNAASGSSNSGAGSLPVCTAGGIGGDTGTFYTSDMAATGTDCEAVPLLEACSSRCGRREYTPRTHATIIAVLVSRTVEFCTMQARDFFSGLVRKDSSRLP